MTTVSHHEYHRYESHACMHCKRYVPIRTSQFYMEGQTCGRCHVTRLATALNPMARSISPTIAQILRPQEPHFRNILLSPPPPPLLSHRNPSRQKYKYFLRLSISSVEVYPPRQSDSRSSESQYLLEQEFDHPITPLRRLSINTSEVSTAFRSTTAIMVK